MTCLQQIPQLQYKSNVLHRYLRVARQQLGRTAAEEEDDLLAADSATPV